MAPADQRLQPRQPLISRLQYPMASTQGTGLPASIPAPLAHVALTLVALLPLVVPVPANLNVIVTACLTVFTGCWRSVKPTPPAEAMSKKVSGAASTWGRSSLACLPCCGTVLEGSVAFKRKEGVAAAGAIFVHFTDAARAGVRLA